MRTEEKERNRVKASGGEHCAEVLSKVCRVIKNLKRSRENIDSAEQELMRAERDYKTAKRRYEQGSAAADEVKVALESLSMANVSSSQARNDFQIAMIGLEEILSIDFSGILEDREESGFDGGGG
jgi:Outer membrane protein